MRSSKLKKHTARKSAPVGNDYLLIERHHSTEVLEDSPATSKLNDSFTTQNCKSKSPLKNPCSSYKYMSDKLKKKLIVVLDDKLKSPSGSGDIAKPSVANTPRKPWDSNTSMADQFTKRLKMVLIGTMKQSDNVQINKKPSSGSAMGTSKTDRKSNATEGYQSKTTVTTDQKPSHDTSSCPDAACIARDRIHASDLSSCSVQIERKKFLSGDSMKFRSNNMDLKSSQADHKSFDTGYSAKSRYNSGDSAKSRSNDKIHGSHAIKISCKKSLSSDKTKPRPKIGVPKKTLPTESGGFQTLETDTDNLKLTCNSKQESVRDQPGVVSKVTAGEKLGNHVIDDIVSTTRRPVLEMMECELTPLESEPDSDFSTEFSVSTEALNELKRSETAVNKKKVGNSSESDSVSLLSLECDEILTEGNVVVDTVKSQAHPLVDRNLSTEYKNIATSESADSTLKIAELPLSPGCISPKKNSTVTSLSSPRNVERNNQTKSTKKTSPVMTSDNTTSDIHNKNNEKIDVSTKAKISDSSDGTIATDLLPSLLTSSAKNSYTDAALSSPKTVELSDTSKSSNKKNSPQQNNFDSLQGVCQPVLQKSPKCNSLVNKRGISPSKPIKSAKKNHSNESQDLTGSSKVDYKLMSSPKSPKSQMLNRDSQKNNLSVSPVVVISGQIKSPQKRNSVKEKDIDSLKKGCDKLTLPVTSRSKNSGNENVASSPKQVKLAKKSQVKKYDSTNLIADTSKTDASKTISVADNHVRNPPKSPDTKISQMESPAKSPIRQKTKDLLLTGHSLSPSTSDSGYKEIKPVVNNLKSSHLGSSTEMSGNTGQEGCGPSDQRKGEIVNSSDENCVSKDSRNVLSSKLAVNTSSFAGLQQNKNHNPYNLEDFLLGFVTGNAKVSSEVSKSEAEILTEGKDPASKSDADSGIEENCWVSVSSDQQTDVLKIHLKKATKTTGVCNIPADDNYQKQQQGNDSSDVTDSVAEEPKMISPSNIMQGCLQTPPSELKESIELTVHTQKNLTEEKSDVTERGIENGTDCSKQHKPETVSKDSIYDFPDSPTSVEVPVFRKRGRPKQNSVNKCNGQVNEPKAKKTLSRSESNPAAKRRRVRSSTDDVLPTVKDINKDTVLDSIEIGTNTQESIATSGKDITLGHSATYGKVPKKRGRPKQNLTNNRNGWRADKASTSRKGNGNLPFKKRWIKKSLADGLSTDKLDIKQQQAGTAAVNKIPKSSCVVRRQRRTELQLLLNSGAQNAGAAPVKVRMYTLTSGLVTWMRTSLPFVQREYEIHFPVIDVLEKLCSKDIYSFSEYEKLDKFTATREEKLLLQKAQPYNKRKYMEEVQLVKFSQAMIESRDRKMTSVVQQGLPIREQGPNASKKKSHDFQSGLNEAQRGQLPELSGKKNVTKRKKEKTNLDIPNKVKEEARVTMLSAQPHFCMPDRELDDLLVSRNDEDLANECRIPDHEDDSGIESQNVKVGHDVPNNLPGEKSIQNGQNESQVCEQDLQNNPSLSKEPENWVDSNGRMIKKRKMEEQTSYEKEENTDFNILKDHNQETETDLADENSSRNINAAQSEEKVHQITGVIQQAEVCREESANLQEPLIEKHGSTLVSHNPDNLVDHSQQADVQQNPENGSFVILYSQSSSMDSEDLKMDLAEEGRQFDEETETASETEIKVEFCDDDVNLTTQQTTGECDKIAASADVVGQEILQSTHLVAQDKEIYGRQSAIEGEVEPKSQVQIDEETIPVSSCPVEPGTSSGVDDNAALGGVLVEEATETGIKISSVSSAEAHIKRLWSDQGTDDKDHRVTVNVLASNKHNQSSEPMETVTVSKESDNALLSPVATCAVPVKENIDAVEMRAAYSRRKPRKNEIPSRIVKVDDQSHEVSESDILEAYPRLSRLISSPSGEAGRIMPETSTSKVCSTNNSPNSNVGIQANQILHDSSVSFDHVQNNLSVVNKVIQQVLEPSGVHIGNHGNQTGFSNTTQPEEQHASNSRTDAPTNPPPVDPSSHRNYGAPFCASNNNSQTDTPVINLGPQWNRHLQNSNINTQQYQNPSVNSIAQFQNPIVSHTAYPQMRGSGGTVYQQNASVSVTGYQQNTNVSNTVQLQNTNVSNAMQLQNTNVSNAMQLQNTNVSNAMQLQNTNVSNTMQLQNTNASNTMQLQNNNVSNAMQLQNTNVNYAMQLQNTNASNTMQLQNTNVSNAMQLQNTNVNYAMQLQNTNRSNTMQLQNNNASNTMQLQNNNASNTMQLQNTNLSSTVQLQNTSVSIRGYHQNSTLSNTVHPQNVSVGSTALPQNPRMSSITHPHHTDVSRTQNPSVDVPAHPVQGNWQTGYDFIMRQGNALAGTGQLNSNVNVPANPLPVSSNSYSSTSLHSASTVVSSSAQRSRSRHVSTSNANNHTVLTAVAAAPKTVRRRKRNVSAAKKANLPADHPAPINSGSELANQESNFIINNPELNISQQDSRTAFGILHHSHLAQYGVFIALQKTVHDQRVEILNLRRQLQEEQTKYAKVMAELQLLRGRQNQTSAPSSSLYRPWHES